MTDPFDKPIDWLTGTTATTATHNATTYAEVIAAMETVMRDLGEEPIAKWMRSQNCPPELWTLVLPMHLRGLLGEFPPSYVQFSTVITTPVFIRTNRGRHFLELLPHASPPHSP
jgi:hypothetical protein